MAEQNEIRKPAVAGMFYPAEPAELARQLAQFYSEAKKKAIPGHPIGIIAPHAGYTYSGKTASEAYKQLEGEQYDTVVVISPSHTVFFQGVSVYNGSAYETPIGTVEVDEELSRRISQIHPGVFLSNKGHTGGSVRGEHALEVQLPFLQQMLGRFKLVAMVMGDQEESTARSLGEVLASVLSGKNCLIVASTDLSHFYTEKEAHRLDDNIRRAVEQYNPDRLQNVLGSGKGEACGGGPMIAMMIATRRMGGEKVVVTRYSTSAEASGDFKEVVGYLSAVVVSSKKPKSADITMGAMPKRESETLTDDEKQYLLDLAKRSIKAGLEKTDFDEPEPVSRLLKEKRGAFVTIKINGSLRGCIGMIRAAQPLYQAVAEMARAAAFEDPRFAELSQREFDKIEVEISVLSPLVRVNDFNEIKVGRDGLLIRMDMHSGLLLPQVASEYNWDRVTFLEQTCLKAGLPKNSYKEKNAEVYRFTADVF